MARMTREQVEHYITVLNSKLANMGAPLQYRIRPVAGGYALDKYKGDVQVDYCVSGQSLREVYEIVRFAANMICDNVK